MPDYTALGKTPTFFSDAVKRRNTLADWMFYDVGALTQKEFTMLSRQTNLEGAILVVEPSGSGDSVRIQKFETFRSFRTEPGELLRHFSIAGVGSSDVGAAALARSLANHLDAPVGAIVAGYGMSDLLSEALGGWLFFGTSNQLLNLAQNTRDMSTIARGIIDDKGVTGEPTEPKELPGTDTRTLIRLLSEEERKIETILGHSKGCLSIAYALQSMAAQPDQQHINRARDIDIITTGAVVAFPERLNRVRQYLGSLDWFGRMNSRMHLPYTNVPNAWHHLNSKMNFHMNLPRVLAGDYD